MATFLSEVPWIKDGFKILVGTVDKFNQLRECDAWERFVVHVCSRPQSDTVTRSSRVYTSRDSLLMVALHPIGSTAETRCMSSSAGNGP